MTLAEFQERLRVISDQMRIAHLQADECYRREIEGLMKTSKDLAQDEPEQFLATCRAEAERFQRLMAQYHDCRK